MYIKIWLVALLLSLVPAYAEDTLEGKVDALKEKLRSYWLPAPKLNVYQKTLITPIVAAHKSGIRETAQEVRALVLATRKEVRNLLTREQLLKVMDLRDEFALRGPGIKAALFLSKLETAERITLLELARELWRGDKKQAPQNLANLRVFFQEKVRPRIFAELEMTADQIASCKKICDAAESKLNQKLIELLHQVYDLRAAIRPLLTHEQTTFIETNRDKIFQELITFVSDL